MNIHHDKLHIAQTSSYHPLVIKYASQCCQDSSSKCRGTYSDHSLSAEGLRKKNQHLCTFSYKTEGLMETLMASASYFEAV